MNYLFVHDYHTLKDLTFPIGVFGFLKIPTTEGNNFLLSLLFYSAIKLFFLYRFIRFSQSNGRSNFLSVFIAMIAAIFLKIDFLIVAICALQGLILIDRKRWIDLVLMVAIAYIGLTIKSSIGIISFSVVATACLYFIYRYRSVKKSVLLIAVTVVVIAILGSLIYGSTQRAFIIFYEAFKMSSDYSAATLHPDNDWNALSICILSILISPFLFRSNRYNTAFIILLPALFLMWKHAMSRQEFGHALFFFQFLFIFWAFMICYSKVRVSSILFLAFISIFFFRSNLKQMDSWSKEKIEITKGPNSFVKSVLDYSSYVAFYDSISKSKIQKLELDDEVLKLIGNRSIDIFPWQLAYIPANNLNWRVRQNLQGGGYSKWLDQISANSFSYESGPDFVLLNLSKDKYEGYFGAIDNIHLFHYSPLSAFEILKNYEVIYSSEYFLLMEKRKIASYSEEYTSSDKKEVQWNEWVKVMEDEGQIVKIYGDVKLNAIGKVKQFLYKSDQYFIELMMENGSILEFRIDPSELKRGLWLNPFDRFPQDDRFQEEIKMLRFTTMNSFGKNDRVSIQFKKYAIIDSDFLFSAKDGNSKVQKEYLNNFEEGTYLGKLNRSRTDIAFEGNGAQQLDPKDYSYTFRIELDTLFDRYDSSMSHLFLETEVRTFGSTDRVNLVIAVKNSRSEFWKPVKSHKRANGQWNYLYNTKILDRNDYRFGVLEIYVLNNGQNELIIDNLKLRISDVEFKNNR
ncbi:MAG: hypothetical protein HKN92_08790 [Chitinophagales bacterium]|nr:hypothetical protein [Chitinophagales bacterium]